MAQAHCNGPSDCNIFALCDRPGCPGHQAPNWQDANKDQRIPTCIVNAERWAGQPNTCDQQRQSFNVGDKVLKKYGGNILEVDFAPNNFPWFGVKGNGRLFACCDYILASAAAPPEPLAIGDLVMERGDKSAAIYEIDHCSVAYPGKIGLKERPGDLFNGERFMKVERNNIAPPEPPPLATVQFMKSNTHVTPPINTITRDDVATFQSSLQGRDIDTMSLYQIIALKSAIYPGKGTALGLVYCNTKHCGEAGELSEHIGKAMRDDRLIIDRNNTNDVVYRNILFGKLTPERRNAIIKEIGDNLWYLAAICAEIGITISDAALANLEKLADRTERGKLQGSGDDR